MTRLYQLTLSAAELDFVERAVLLAASFHVMAVSPSRERAAALSAGIAIVIDAADTLRPSGVLALGERLAELNNAARSAAGSENEA